MNQWLMFSKVILGSGILLSATVFAHVCVATQTVSVNTSQMSDTVDESVIDSASKAMIRKSDVAEKYRKQADMMFDIMAGEMSGANQDTAAAVKHYLNAIQHSTDPGLAERAMRIAFYARDNVAALTASKRWSTLAPLEAEPHRYLSILHLRLGKKDLSLAAIKQYYEKNKAAKDERYEAIVALFLQETDTELAYQVVQDFFKEHAKNPEALYGFAQFAIKLKRHDAALQHIDAALAIKPGWEQAVLMRARILVTKGEKDRAIKDMRKFLAQNSKSKSMRINYARLLTEAGRFKDARVQFELLLKRSPNDGDLIYALALLSMESKEFETATNYFKRLVSIGQREVDAHFHLGLIAEEQRHYDSAIAWLTKVREGDRAVDAHLRIASIMSKKGDIEAARRFLYQLKPRTKMLQVRLFLAESEILNRANRIPDALDVINNALIQYPDDHDLLYGRAMIAERLDKIDLVETDLRKILLKDPKNAQALNALGYTLADRTKRYREAHGFIKQAIELAPDQAAIVDSMGWVQYRLGNHVEAIKYLKRALTLDNNAEIAAHLGEVLWVTGDKTGARKVWDKARQIDRTNKVLNSTLKRLEQ